MNPPEPAPSLDRFLLRTYGARGLSLEEVVCLMAAGLFLLAILYRALVYQTHFTEALLLLEVLAIEPQTNLGGWDCCILFDLPHSIISGHPAP
jgi:hypothetical protein